MYVECRNFVHNEGHQRFSDFLIHTSKLFGHFSYTPLPSLPSLWSPPPPGLSPSCVFAKPHQKRVVLTFYYLLYKLRHHSSITLQEERAAISVLL